MIFAFPLALAKLQFLRRLGGIGLVLVGIVDSSVIPLPGSLDLFTILLSALHQPLWFYYALMSTIGSLIGGYLTYKIGKKGGAEALEHRVLSASRMRSLEGKFEKYGFGTVFVGVILPPPFPMAPVLVAAGAFDYPVRKFLVALGLGRLLRFGVIAYVGSTYGRGVHRFAAEHEHTFIFILIVFACLIAAGGAFYFLYYRRRRGHAAA